LLFVAVAEVEDRPVDELKLLFALMQPPNRQRDLPLRELDMVVLQLRERPAKQVGLEARIVQAEVISIPPDTVTLSPASSPAIEDLTSGRGVQQELPRLGCIFQPDLFNGHWLMQLILYRIPSPDRAIQLPAGHLLEALAQDTGGLEMAPVHDDRPHSGEQKRKLYRQPGTLQVRRIRQKLTHDQPDRMVQGLS
jgi:hypothetical protein